MQMVAGYGVTILTLENMNSVKCSSYEQISKKVSSKDLIFYQKK